MASTFSDLKIELIGTGEQVGTWGNTTNNNFSVAVGEAITGSADVVFSGADVTVTLTDTNAAQTARNLRLNLTGTSGGARNLILGSGCQIEKLYLINNGLADAVTVKNTTGTGIAVPAGKSMFVFNNGTNVVEAINSLVTLDVTTLNATNVNATTVDTTNLEVTNLKAKDGTAAGSIANSTGVVTLGSSVLTTTAIIGGSINNTTVGASTASTGSFTSLTDSGNLTFTGTGNRITGDFSNGTLANRVAFQTSTTNGFTTVAIFPNGTGNIAQLQIYNNSDPTNASRASFLISSTESRLSSELSGTGTFLPLTMFTGGSERLRIDTSGNVGIGTSSPTKQLTVANDASISGLTVGKGGGAVGTNTTLGFTALSGGSQSGVLNTAIGYESLQVNTSGLANTSIGSRNMTSNTTGQLNTSVGDIALNSNTTGSSNTAVGQGALQLNTTASNNTAVGFQAGFSNTTGGSNTANGFQALFSNTTGSNNTANGVNALLSNTTGINTTASGVNALQSNTTGINNTASGNSALFSNTTGSDNTANGVGALISNTTGSQNTASGVNALVFNTTASHNTAVGFQAGFSNTTGIYNTFVGRGAGFNLSTGSGNTLVGVSSLTGEGAGHQITTGSDNTILGGYNGNQDGLDIRTLSNFAVISDGDGNRQITMKEGQTLALDSAVPNAGTGITFPATQFASSDANTLDDYEEGTWTPSFISTGATFAYAEQFGSYVKVGSLVTAQMRLMTSSVTGTTINATNITGIPFASANLNANNASAGAVGLCNVTGGLAMSVGNNESVIINLWNFGIVAQPTAASIDGKFFIATISYRTA